MTYLNAEKKGVLNMAKINLGFIALKTLAGIKISNATKSISTQSDCLVRTRKNTSDYNLSPFSKKFGKLVIYPKSNLNGIVKIESREKKTYLSQPVENDKWKISFRFDSPKDMTFPSKEIEGAYSTLAKIIHYDVNYVEFGLHAGEILPPLNPVYLYSKNHYPFNLN